MTVIIGILIAIILYFRIKKIIRIFFSLRFWIGLLMNAVFFYVVYKYFPTIKETLSYYIYTYTDFFTLEDIELVAIIVAGAMCFFIWVFLCGRSRAFVTPFIFVLSVATLGLVIFNVSDGFDSAFDDGDEYGGDDSSSNQTWVDPHEVSGYVRSDGTQVAGYTRDGDGDTSVDRSLEEGGGYFRKY
ncbi:hypothetical protein [Metabacillus bambusae]|uniref:Uncharacterized protein n=1 Tax=Metabacillus bambusae TaxID=2795218 RepID=A0ABS3NAL4_9BACI|nr:hypothetical protein [Metabacillus bambusae]MBO1515195.1 hypothetical protein [Metabacillus bambusae]